MDRIYQDFKKKMEPSSLQYSILCKVIILVEIVSRTNLYGLKALEPEMKATAHVLRRNRSIRNRHPRYAATWHCSQPVSLSVFEERGLF